LTNFGNRCRFTAGDLKDFFLFFCFDFLHIDPQGLKSEGERLKVKFWSSEMVKIGRGQQNYRRCRCRHRLQSFVMMKNSVIRSAMDALRNSKKNLPPSCSHSLFINIFQFDFGCTSAPTLSLKLIVGKILKRTSTLGDFIIYVYYETCKGPDAVILYDSYMTKRFISSFMRNLRII
jgi:hypothetical protein